MKKTLSAILFIIGIVMILSGAYTYYNDMVVLRGDHIFIGIVIVYLAYKFFKI